MARYYQAYYGHKTVELFQLLLLYVFYLQIDSMCNMFT